MYAPISFHSVCSLVTPTLRNTNTSRLVYDVELKKKLFFPAKLDQIDVDIATMVHNDKTKHSETTDSLLDSQ